MGVTRCRGDTGVIKCVSVNHLEMYDVEAIIASEPSPGQREGLGSKLCVFKHRQSLFYSSGPLKQMTRHFGQMKQPFPCPPPIECGILKG